MFSLLNLPSKFAYLNGNFLSYLHDWCHAVNNTSWVAIRVTYVATWDEKCRKWLNLGRSRREITKIRIFSVILKCGKIRRISHDKIKVRWQCNARIERCWGKTWPNRIPSLVIYHRSRPAAWESSWYWESVEFYSVSIGWNQKLAIIQFQHCHHKKLVGTSWTF